MNAYLNECSRLYEKYHVGNNQEAYLAALKERKIVDIPFVEMTVTTHCNLRCRYCSNLIPYLPQQHHFALEEVKAQLDILLKNVHWIYRLKIHGGEPLAYPYIGDILQYALEKSQIFDVRISTNGTILPERELLQIMKNPKFILHISGYSFLEKRAHELCQCLKEQKIRFYYMKDQAWCDLGDPMQKRKRKRAETESVIDECNMRKCSAYYQGMLYVCSWAANRDAILQMKRGLPIDHVGMGFQIRDFYEQRYFECCDYCNGILAESPLIPAGEQLFPNINI